VAVMSMTPAEVERKVEAKLDTVLDLLRDR
jgi:hypothetical protein